MLLLCQVPRCLLSCCFLARKSPITALNSNAVAIVGDLQQLAAALLDDHGDLRRPRVEAVLEQLLERRARALNDLAGRDAVHHRLVQPPDDRQVGGGSVLLLLLPACCSRGGGGGRGHLTCAPRLRRLLWSAAAAQRHSGHAEHRPWAVQKPFGAGGANARCARCTGRACVLSGAWRFGGVRVTPLQNLAAPLPCHAPLPPAQRPC